MTGRITPTSAPCRTDDGRFAEEIVPVTVPAGRGETVTVSVDEHRAGTRRRRAGGVALADRARRPGHRRELLGHCRRGRRLVLVSRSYAEATAWRRWRPAVVESCGIEPARTGLRRPSVCPGR